MVEGVKTMVLQALYVIKIQQGRFLMVSLAQKKDGIGIEGYIAILQSLALPCI